MSVKSLMEAILAVLNAKFENIARLQETFGLGISVIEVKKDLSYHY